MGQREAPIHALEAMVIVGAKEILVLNMMIDILGTFFIFLGLVLVDKAWERVKLSSPLNKKTQIRVGRLIIALRHNFYGKASTCLNENKNKSLKSLKARDSKSNINRKPPYL